MWVCKKCGEVNCDSFEKCPKCGSYSPDFVSNHSKTVVSEETNDGIPPKETSSKQDRKLGWNVPKLFEAVICCLFIGSFIYASVIWSTDYPFLSTLYGILGTASLIVLSISGTAPSGRTIYAVVLLWIIGLLAHSFFLLSTTEAKIGVVMCHLCFLLVCFGINGFGSFCNDAENISSNCLLIAVGLIMLLFWLVLVMHSGEKAYAVIPLSDDFANETELRLTNVLFIWNIVASLTTVVYSFYALDRS